MRRSILLAVLPLAACAMPNYVPAHDQNIEQAAADRAYCKAFAEGVTPGTGGGFVYAQGSPQFVGATMGAYGVASLIAVAVRQQHKLDNYDDCMVARGYRKQQSNVATASVSTPVAAATPPARSVQLPTAPDNNVAHDPTWIWNGSRWVPPFVCATFTPARCEVPDAETRQTLIGDSLARYRP
jgi:hypothetical protein